MAILGARSKVTETTQTAALPRSIAHYPAEHKRLSFIISTALLVALLVWLLSLGNQKTDASTAANGSVQGTSVQVESTSSSKQDSPAPESSQSSSVNTSVNQTGSGSSHTQVQVNGQNIPVPENGSVEQTVPANDNHSDVHVMINNQTSGSGSTSSSTTQVISNSSSSVQGGSVAE